MISSTTVHEASPFRLDSVLGTSNWMFATQTKSCITFSLDMLYDSFSHNNMVGMTKQEMA